MNNEHNRINFPCCAGTNCISWQERPKEEKASAQAFAMGQPKGLFRDKLADMRYLIGNLGWRYGYLCGKVFTVDELTSRHMELVQRFKTYQIFDTEECKVFMPETNEWKSVPIEKQQESNVNSQT